MAEADNTDLTQLTVQLLSAYLANNIVAQEDIADLITTTRTVLSGEVTPPAPLDPEYTPAVSIRKSLASPDHLISLIDGKPYKMLKRHLASNGLTPVQYRERYGLAREYPMVARTYSEERRATAARIGLGTRALGKTSPQETAAAASSSVAPASSNATESGAKVKAARAPQKKAIPSKSAAPAAAKKSAAAPKGDRAARPAKAEKPAAAVKPAEVALDIASMQSTPETVVTAPIKTPRLKNTKDVVAPSATVVAPPSGDDVPAKRAGRPKKAKLSIVA